MKTVLFVVSAADRWTLNDGTVHPSGYWGEEVAVPHRIFTEAGWRVAIATPGGKPPTLDQLSVGLAGGLPRKTAHVRDYLHSIAAELENTVPLDEIDADEFDLVFYPGGHGPMEDLAYNETSGQLLTKRLQSGKPLALLCHAPAAILAARNPDGTSPFAGYRMTGLSNREELLNRFAKKAPWLLEDRLKQAGVDYSKRKIPLRPYVVIDRNLYTGQNPASSEKLAKRLVAELSGPVLEVVVSRVIDAPREQLWAFISDMTHMGEISPENRKTAWIEPGRRFVGRNHIGPLYRWSMTGTVTENVPGKVFAFLTDSPSESHWRYTFADAEGGGTRVTESIRKHTKQIRPVVLLQDMAGATDRSDHLRDGMRTTLERLAAKFEPSTRLADQKA